MEANDLVPNRLEAAKSALQEFIKTRKSDRVGLVLFA
ncbi:VWA domain-containing protein [Patescibacteria group bacterium]|nr:VWA domain-containing protein [Patescibacteria group bacterium]